jgi:hypothetical protein
MKFFAALSATSLVSDGLGADSTKPTSKGYGTDPVLQKIYTPGEVWPLTLSPEQRQTATTLADLLLPADQFGPAASALKVPEFIDEWVSAPYPEQQEDQPIILNGLAWIEAESKQRYSADFTKLTADQQHAICEDIAAGTQAKPKFRSAAKFFRRFRHIAATAYYGTMEGWKAIGYVGNLTTATFDGPPPEVLDRLGLEQVVK